MKSIGQNRDFFTSNAWKKKSKMHDEGVTPLIVLFLRKGLIVHFKNRPLASLYLLNLHSTCLKLSGPSQRVGCGVG